MSTTNKELIAKLVDYYLKQPPEIVARALAGTMIDICRVRSLDKLPETEVASLLERIDKNASELHKFAKHGPSGDLKVHVINSEKEHQE